jgi:hypothetical protein
VWLVVICPQSLQALDNHIILYPCAGAGNGVKSINEIKNRKNRNKHMHSMSGAVSGRWKNSNQRDGKHSKGGHFGLGGTTQDDHCKCGFQE